MLQTFFTHKRDLVWSSVLCSRGGTHRQTVFITHGTTSQTFIIVAAIWNGCPLMIGGAGGGEVVVAGYLAGW